MKILPALISLTAVVIGSVGCGSADVSSTIAAEDGPAGVRRLLDDPPAPSADTFEVSVCSVPADTTDPLFGELTLRLDLDPATIADQMNDHVTPYFRQLTGERYRPTFVGGRVLSMATGETHRQCVERAVDASGAATSAVMVVANAEHVATAPGGWGRVGEPCEVVACPAGETRRALYVGASDFHPDWGEVPLLDLIEHEIGHTLGLPHSGDGAAGEDQHASALDLMSNSAAPRELAGAADAADADAVDLSTQRKHGQDTLAINRLALGWLDPAGVAVVSEHGGEFDLSPSFAADGLRLLILPIDDETFLTVEHLAAAGLDDFLPQSGLAVHRIDQRPAACAQPSADTAPCTGVDRAQITLGSPAPHTDLLDRVGDSWVLDGWTVTVGSVGDRMGVEVRPTER